MNVDDFLNRKPIGQQVFHIFVGIRVNHPKMVNHNDIPIQSIQSHKMTMFHDLTIQLLLLFAAIVQEIPRFAKPSLFGFAKAALALHVFHQLRR